MATNRRTRAQELSEMVETTLDEMLRILENPTRRRILERLATESHYPLQLSKELGVSQQAVVKHLRALEDSGLVESSEEKSDLGGPNRRAYSARQHVSVHIDLGPSLFHAEMRPISRDIEAVEGYGWAEEALRKAREDRDPKRRLRSLSQIVRKLNQDLDDLEKRRAYIMSLKEGSLREIHRGVGDVVSDYEARQVLNTLLEGGEKALDRIAERLDLREKVVADVLKRIEREFRLDWGD